ncbi:carotene biosynthesis associated membrane protein [Dermatophilus congolensis]|uniref:Carotene biosynthesis associated membrane protein n=1 Tax=Dermatophilus congolensis TaxID=1863 RepID=A0AA46BNY4_9MICO|nr:polyprenol phosphomannose-dependent alpha 1,6 mannosyltransferase MptB [Dermatophilus congolensis]STD11078.1 carotene biosynthesis associated membrane protein [Dermatophilus congolensis]
MTKNEPLSQGQTTQAHGQTQQPRRGMSTRVRGSMRALVSDARAAFAVPAVWLGLFGSVLIVVGSFTPASLPPDSELPYFIGLGLLQTGVGRAVAAAAVLLGMASLLLAWVAMRPGRHGVRGGVPRATWWLWSLPMLVAPPLFSRDAYSYAAQGLLVSRGMDPYSTGPISVPGPFADQVDPMWLFTSAPYGPLALRTQQLVVELSFDNAYFAAVAMRVPAFMSMALIASLLPRMTERVGVSVEPARWIGIANPLILIHLVGGAHNDAMAVALIVAAMLLAFDGRFWISSLTIAAAAGYKQTALLAMVALAGYLARRAVVARRIHEISGGTPSCEERTAIEADRHEPTGPVRGAPHDPGAPGMVEYIRVAAAVGTASIGLFALITFVCGLGWGWVESLSVPLMARSILSPSTVVGSVGQIIMLGLGSSAETAQIPLDTARACGMAIMAIGLIWTTLWLAPRRPTLSVVTAFVIFVACGSVVHAWYMIPVFVLLGLVPFSERTYTVAMWVIAVLGVYAAFDSALGNGSITIAVTLVAALVLRMRARGVLPLPANLRARLAGQHRHAHIEQNQKVG